MSDIDLTDPSDTPVLDTLTAMTAVSIDTCGLDPRELMLARIAALAAVDAPPESYLLNAGAAADCDVTLEDAEGVLVAVAPIIGSPRTLAAAGNITSALGFAIAAMDEELRSRST